MRAAQVCAILACLATGASGREVARWNHAGTPHFDIYSNADAEAARTLALGFERLHAFFVRQAETPDSGSNYTVSVRSTASSGQSLTFTAAGGGFAHCGPWRRVGASAAR